MMVPAFRILFDVSVYYTVSGIYLQAFCQKVPLLAGYLLLCAAVIFYSILSVWKPGNRFVMFVFLIPVAVLVFRPDVMQLLQIVAAWFYAGFTQITNRADAEYRWFFKRIWKGLALVGMSLIPVALAIKPVFLYLENVLFYFIMAILCSVICLRCLRDRIGGMRQMGLIFGFAATCGVLVYFHIPQFLLLSVRNGIIFLLYQLETLFHLIPTFSTPNQQSNSRPDNGLADGKSGVWFAGAGDSGSNPMVIILIEVLLSLVVTAAALYLLWKLLYGLIKDMKKTEERKPIYRWNDEVVRLRMTDNEEKAAKRRKKSGSSQQLVRYYYWKYMCECTKRGIKIRKGWTAEDLSRASTELFRPADITAMQQLYMPVRYDDHAKVNPADVKEAARLWQELKKYKPKT